MIEEYVRPATLQEAIRILESDSKSVFPLGGGNVLSRSDSGNMTVVDLQLLNFDKITAGSSLISIGACVTLQSLIESDSVPPAIKDASIREGTINTRRTATIAGTLVSSKGQSPLGAVLLAMGAKVKTEPNRIILAIEEWISTLKDGKPSKLVVELDIPVKGKTVYMDVSKTPADSPLVFSSMNLDDNGAYTWVLGIRNTPQPYIESGENPSEFPRNAYSHFISNIKNNSYQKQLINVLHQRLIHSLTENGRSK